MRVRDALKRFFSPESLETGMVIDPATGVPAGFSAKITFHEPSVEEEGAGVLSVDQIYEDLNGVLEREVLSIWIILDRLDAAFTASPDLEANALRALFRVYRMLEPLRNLRLKIFLRSDIWSDITTGGFRETSHITRDMNLQWNRANLLKLIVQRVIQSGLLVKELGLDSAHVIASSEAQQQLFNLVYPRQVDAGSNKPATFDWALSRTEDGKKVAAPRELIHLFSTVREHQLTRIDTGQASIGEGVYFEAQSFRDAHPEVSETRLQKTIYAEYPWLRTWLEGLRGQRTLQNQSSLEKIWGTDAAETKNRVRRLVDIGFFEQRGPISERTYWVPFLYRHSLELVQGTADVPRVESDQS